MRWPWDRTKETARIAELVFEAAGERQRTDMLAEAVAESVRAQQAEREAAASVPAPTPVRCPECQSIEGVPVVNLKSYAITHAGVVVESVIGYRIACQRCPKIYSVSGTGVFRHHPQSSPPTPEARAQVERDEQPSANNFPPQELRPMPKERPRV